MLRRGVSQHVNKPTRGNNILDPIFPTNYGLVNNVNTGTELSISDHKNVKDFDAKQIR